MKFQLPVPPPPARLEEVPCPACASTRSLVLGLRGNREHYGADPAATPHVATFVVRCRDCDLFYTNPMIRGLEHLEKAYYDDPQTYQAVPGRDFSGMFRERLTLLGRHRAPGALLDVGAGKGEFLAAARDAGWTVSGVEPSGNFCRYARERHGVEVVCGLLGRSPAPGWPFDAASLNHVLEHVDDPRSFLGLVRSQLKPGGVLFIEVPNTDSHFLRLADFYFRLQGKPWSTRLSPVHPPFHRIGFTRRSLGFILAACGFEALELTTFPGSDRGYRPGGGWSPGVVLRGLASWALSQSGNGELLAAVARKP